MAKSQRDLNEKLKVKYMEQLEEMLTSNGEQVLKTGNNELTIPVVDETGEEKFLQFVLKVPTGSRDGEAYDGYAMEEDYKLKQKEKAEKKKEAEAKKAKKIEKDKQRREAEKQRREAREGE